MLLKAGFEPALRTGQATEHRFQLLPIREHSLENGNGSGAENGDKCAWTFNVPLVTFSNRSQWKIQGEWSNAAFQRGFIYQNSLASDMGTLGGQYAIAYGINNQNVVVGESSKVGGGSFDVHAFIWTNGVMSDLGTLAGNYSSAKALKSVKLVFGVMELYF